VLFVQVPENASIQMVKSARRHLLSKVHPDQCKFERAPEAFHRVNEAAEKLIAQSR
jgi:DnaJ-class molecular chaperone